MKQHRAIIILYIHLSFFQTANAKFIKASESLLIYKHENKSIMNDLCYGMGPIPYVKIMPAFWKGIHQWLYDKILARLKDLAKDSVVDDQSGFPLVRENLENLEK